LPQQVGADVQGKLVSGDVAARTEKTLSNLKAILATAGSGLERVLKVNIYMPDEGDYAAMNEIYKRVSFYHFVVGWTHGKTGKLG
jgi:2-iminobutanoate/2-iminopropanoate deaminase